MTVYIAFSASPGLGKIIRDVTGGDVNHCLFIIRHDPVLGDWLTLGANPAGFTVEPVEKFRGKKADIIHVFEPVDSSRPLNLSVMRKWLGAPYDYGGLLGMVEVEAVHKLLNDWRVKNPFLDEHALFCSEAGIMVCRDNGYHLLPAVPAGSTDPNMLCQAIIASPDFQEVPNWRNVSFAL